MVAAALYSSEYDSWCTPANVLERVYRVGPAPFPTVLLYWGKRVKRFAAAFEDAGVMWVR